MSESFDCHDHPLLCFIYIDNHFHFLKNFPAGGVFPEGRIGNVQLTGGNLTPLPDTKIVMVMMIMICLYDDDDMFV